MQYTCKETVETLPWFLNGSLETGEHAALLEHITFCASCRRELQTADDDFRLLAGHVPSEALVHYALDLPLEDHERNWIAQHVTACSSCREELLLIQAEDNGEYASPFHRPRSSRHVAGLRLAIAASLVAVFSAALLLRQVPSGPSQGSTLAASNVESQRLVPKPQAETRVGVFSDGFESGSTEGWQTSGSRAASRE